VRRLRVGLVCGHFDPTRDGVADYTRHLAGHLRSAGCEALVCTAHRYTDPPGEGVVGVTDDWDAPGVLRAARGLVQLSLDVVHVQFAPSAFGFSRAVGLLPFLVPSSTPVLATLHEFGVWTARGGRRLRSSVWSAAERRWGLDRETLGLTTRARRVLVTSPEHVDVVTARFAGRGLDASYMPIAANIPAVPPDCAQRPRALLASLGLPVDARLVVFFGFLHPVKGLERLIEAVATIQSAHPALRLVLVGGEESHSVSREAAGVMRQRLEDAARHHGVEDRVIFTGYLPESDVSGLLRAADAAVFPFDAGVTAKSSSLLAALAHGVPTIATVPPGELDCVTEVDGVLRVPPRNTAALADALHSVLSDRGLAARLAETGHGCATRWTWPRIAGIHAQMYAEVLRDAEDVDASIRGGRPI
jgi:glycosyltransferase involved in cell wall biosynthesis